MATKKESRPRGRPTKEGQPLSRQRVLKAALAQADREGPDSVTMRSLATSLGVTPMSLYNYFPSRQALLAGVADTLLLEFVPPEGTARATPDALRALATALRAFLKDHPRVAGLLSSRAIRGATLLANGDAPGRVGDAQAALAIDAVVGLTVGLTLAEIAEASRPEAADSERIFSYGIDTLIDGIARRDGARGIS